MTPEGATCNVDWVAEQSPGKQIVSTSGINDPTWYGEAILFDDGSIQVLMGCPEDPMMVLSWDSFESTIYLYDDLTFTPTSAKKTPWLETWLLSGTVEHAED